MGSSGEPVIHVSAEGVGHGVTLGASDPCLWPGLKVHKPKEKKARTKFQSHSTGNKWLDLEAVALSNYQIPQGLSDSSSND